MVYVNQYKEEDSINIAIHRRQRREFMKLYRIARKEEDKEESMQ